MPPAPQVFEALQQHFKVIQGRRRVAAFQVVVQPVDQFPQLRVIQPQHRGGLKLVPVAIHGVVQDTGILQPLLICAILWGEKCFYILFELVRVAARAGSFFLPGHKPISLERKAASLLVSLLLWSLALSS